jgi:nucleotide-binding universal stress UspA family protein
MSYAAMIVHVGEEAYSDSRLRLASQLARRFNAKLIGLAAEEQRPLFVTDGFVADGELARLEYQEIAERLAGMEEYFRTCVGAMQQAEWRAAVGNPVAVIAAEMRAADIAILGREPPGADSFRALDPAAALIRLGRPALIAPSGVDALDASNVIISWKDTRECRRAVADALPFLHEADSVLVVEVHADEEDAGMQARLDDTVRYLARHRIKARREAVRQTKPSIAEELIRVAHENEADLIVAGAYGHSRFGEWVFGGVTRDLLATSPICCLMSH